MEKEAEKRPGEMAPFSKSLSYKHEDLPEFESPPKPPKNAQHPGQAPTRLRDPEMVNACPRALSWPGISDPMLRAAPSRC